MGVFLSNRVFTGLGFVLRGGSGGIYRSFLSFRSLQPQSRDRLFKLYSSRSTFTVQSVSFDVYMTTAVKK